MIQCLTQKQMLTTLTMFMNKLGAGAPRMLFIIAWTCLIKLDVEELAYGRLVLLHQLVPLRERRKAVDDVISLDLSRIDGLPVLVHAELQRLVTSGCEGGHPFYLVLALVRSVFHKLPNPEPEFVLL